MGLAGFCNKGEDLARTRGWNTIRGLVWVGGAASVAGCLTRPKGVRDEVEGARAGRSVIGGAVDVEMSVGVVALLEEDLAIGGEPLWRAVGVSTSSGDAFG